MKDSTRRRLLALSAAGLSSLAGCATTTITGANSDPNAPTNSRDPENTDDHAADGPSNQPPETPAGTIHKRNESSTYSLYDLPVYEEWKHFEQHDWSYYDHPDTRVITAEVGAETISVTINSLRLNRDITLRAHYETASGGVASASKTVSPESDRFTAYHWTLETGEDRPQLANSQVEFTVQDTRSGDNAERSLLKHQYLAIPYENADGNGIHYLNDKAINYDVYFNDQNRHVETRPERYYSEHIDTQTDRTRFFATYAFDRLYHRDAHGSLLGACSTVTHDEYTTYKANERNSRYRSRHHPAKYIANADEYDYITTLADTFTTSLDNAGITSHFMRLEMLNLLLGSMDYEGDPMGDPQFATIYEGTGDCTEHTWLYLATMHTEEFDNTRGVFIDCYLSGYNRHAVVGIDERDLGNPPDPGEIKFIEPTAEERNDGIPDTRYAFVELTSPAPIGHYSQVEEIVALTDTTGCVRNPQFC